MKPDIAEHHGVLRGTAFGVLFEYALRRSATSLAAYRRSTTIAPAPWKGTGQLSQIAEIVLYHYEARFYRAAPPWGDPAIISHFVSADTMVPSSRNVLDLNRYSYVRYNPLKYDDPSGNFWVNVGSQQICSADPDSNGYWGNQPISSQPFYFTRLPVSEKKLEGLQWFGASQNTRSLFNKGNKIYNYCRGLHCGLDLLAPYGTPVYAGVYGVVEEVWNQKSPSLYEGPYKVRVKVSDYTITYGHLDGTTSLNEGDPVFPWTRLGGVGNMGGNPQSNEVNHIHLEIRGPDGWSGDSQNPYHFFNSRDQVLLIEVSKAQEIWGTWGRFYDGSANGAGWPPPKGTHPKSITRSFNSYWE